MSNSALQFSLGQWVKTVLSFYSWEGGGRAGSLAKLFENEAQVVTSTYSSTAHNPLMTNLSLSYQVVG